MRLFTQDPIDTSSDHLALVALVEGRKLEVRLQCRWTSPFEAPAGVRYRHGLQLARIGDRDWDFLMRVVVEGAEQPVSSGALSRAQVAAMLGREKQRQIAAVLQGAGRLAHVHGRGPPLEYALEGYTMRRGIACYQLRVRSVVCGENANEEHVSRILVGIERNAVRLLD